MTMYSESDDWLFEVLLRWEDLRRRGKDPDPRVLCADRPELLDELIRRIRELEAIEGLSPDRSWGGSRASDGAPGRDDGRPVGPSEPVVATTRYGRVALLARGGLGEVFVASDEGLNRQVALKEILGPRAHNKRDQALFLAEARVTGNLEHPGIVPVHGLGASPDGRPFYVMKRVQGGTLGDAIRKFHALGSPGTGPGERRRELLRLLARFTAVCNAVHFAHSRMVLHCDLKPKNIILGDYGETTVVDWGLAMPITRPAPGGEAPTDPLVWPFADIEGLQREGAGTRAYMSPEQAAGRLDAMGPESDVFSLGATLYHVLFGSAPAPVGGDPLGRRAEAPPPPGGGRPDVPRALAAVCRKAMSPRPGDRYASASLLADDIEHWLVDEPVSAYRDPLPARVARSVRHNRTKVAAATALLATALVSMAVASIFITKANVEAARNLFGQHRMADLVTEIDRGVDGGGWSAKHLEGLDRKVRELGGLSASLAGMKRQHVNARFADDLRSSLARPHLRPAEVARVVRLVDLMEPRDRELASSLRQAVRNRVSQWQPIADFTPAGGGADAVFDPTLVRAGPGGLEPQGRPGATAGAFLPTRLESRGDVRLEAMFGTSWETASEIGLVLQAVEGHTGPIRALAVSADGRLLASSSDDLTFKIWDLASDRVRVTIRGHRRPSDALAFSPDGRLLATVDPGLGLRLWDAETGAERRFIPRPNGAIASVAFAPDGGAVFTGSTDGSLELWDVTTGRRLAALRDRTGLICCLTPSPDGSLLAVGGEGGSVTLWEVAGRRVRSVLRGPAASATVLDVAFNADGTLLVAGHLERDAQVWEIATGRHVRSMHNRDPWTSRSVDFTPDGRMVIVTNDGGLLVYDLETGQRRDERSHALKGRGVGALSHRGGTLFAGGLDGAIHRWDADDLRDQPRLHPRRGYLFRVGVPRDAGPGDEADRPSRPTLGAVREAGGTLLCEILRDGVVLRQQSVPMSDVPSGGLLLTAGRDGDRLTFQVNHREPFEFRDEFAPGVAPGLLGLEWPAGVGLQRLRASRRTLPEDPKPLERGDHMFADGRYADALAAYREQVIASEQEIGSSGSDAGQQARHKQALCLVALGREDEAARDFERLAAEEGDRWPALAACQLWLIHLGKGRTAKAGEVFKSISNRYPIEKLAALIPVHQRARIVRDTGYRGKSLGFYKSDPGRIPDLRAAIAIADYFEERSFARNSLKFALLRAFRAEGREDQALQYARELVRTFPLDLSPVATIPSLAELSWLLRLNGEPEEALRELDRHLLDGKGDCRKGMELLLLERARVLTALGRPQEAERAIEVLFGRLGRDQIDFEYQAASLVRGFLRERRGDAEGAMSAWRQGILPDGAANPVHGFQWASNLVLLGLTGELTDDRLESLVESLLGYLGKGSPLLVIRMMQMPTAIVRGAWQTPRGRAAAREFAFQTGPFREHIFIPPVTIGCEFLRQSALLGEASDDQEALIREVSLRTFSAFADGSLSQRQLVQMAMAWEGATGFLGWSSVAPTLDPARRGPLAFLLGHRLLRLGRNADAKPLFLAARADARPGSPLRREAEAGLDLADGLLTLPSNPFAPNPTDKAEPEGTNDHKVEPKETKDQDQEASERNPKLAGTHRDRGVGLERRGEHDAAIAEFREALRLDSEDVSAHFHLGCALYYGKHQADEAEREFRQVTRLRPDFPDAHFHLAEILCVVRRQYDASIAESTEAIRLRPDYAEAHLKLGYALNCKGRADEAEARYRLAISLKPDFAEAHLVLATLLYVRNRDPNGTIEQLRETLRLWPDHAESQLRLGVSLLRKGDLAEAETELRKALALGPENADAHNEFGALLGRQRKHDAAIAEFREALRIDPVHVWARLNLVTTLFYAKKDTVAAESEVRTLIRQRPDLARAHFHLAEILRARRRDLDESVREYREAIRLRPDYAEAYLSLGVILRAQGNLDAAGPALQQAIKLAPGSIEARKEYQAFLSQTFPANPFVQ